MLELQAPQFGLAAPGKGSQDHIELGLLGKGAGQVCDVVADASAGAEQRGGVQRDSHPGMFAQVAVDPARSRCDAGARALIPVGARGCRNMGRRRTPSEAVLSTPEASHLP